MWRIKNPLHFVLKKTAITSVREGLSVILNEKSPIYARILTASELENYSNPGLAINQKVIEIPHDLQHASNSISDRTQPYLFRLLLRLINHPPVHALTHQV